MQHLRVRMLKPKQLSRIHLEILSDEDVLEFPDNKSGFFFLLPARLFYFLKINGANLRFPLSGLDED